MKNFKTYTILLLVAFSMQTLVAQTKTDYWEYQKEVAVQKEEQLYKIEIDGIDKMLSDNKITNKESQELKVEAKKKSNTRIKNRIAVINQRRQKLIKDGLKITMKGKDTLIQKIEKTDIIYEEYQAIVLKEKNSGSIKILEQQKEKVKTQEKEALKKEIEAINNRLEKKEITFEEAQLLKAETAKKRALNIENKLAIIDNKIALLERNGLVTTDSLSQKDVFNISINGKPLFNYKTDSVHRIKYDRRTYSDMVIAVGLNNAIIDGQSLEDSPYKIGGSRFFELGVTWRTRVFNNSNFLRFHYGFSFQFNGLKPVDNQYFVRNNEEPELQEFPVELSKSKFRTDNLVFPIHFEFGPSKKRVREKSMRYYTSSNFKVGLGGYGGFNIGARQKLKYKEDGKKQKDKLKGGYNTSNFVYGLSAYAGFGDTQLYVKYDLNPIFKDAVVEQRNISLGVRFDL